MVLYRQELAESTKLQINKVRQLINEMCVNFIHRGIKAKKMLIRNNYVFAIIEGNVIYAHLYPLGSYAVYTGKYFTSNLTYAK
jgi:hypothetical protein